MQSHLRPGGWNFTSERQFLAGLGGAKGRGSAQLFDALFPGKYSRPARNEILHVEIDGETYYIAPHGIHGEDGCRGLLPSGTRGEIVNDILRKGSNSTSSPGASARADTLRPEMCIRSMDRDLSPETTRSRRGFPFS